MIKTVIDIEDALNAIELIINKYNLLDPNLLFVPEYRDPIGLLTKEQKANINSNNVSNIPYNPFLSAYIVKDLMLILSLDVSGCKNDFEVNKLDNTISPVYDNIYDKRLTLTGNSGWLELEMVIESFIPNILEIDLKNILDIWYNNIQPRIEQLFHNHPVNVWSIDITRPYFLISSEQTIFELRYYEYLYNKKLEG